MGWDSLFLLLDQESVAKAQTMTEDVVIGSRNWRRRQMQPGDYTIKQISAEKFELSHKDGKEQYFIDMVSNGDKVEFVGMPEGFQIMLNSFSAEELRKDPLLILQSILKANEAND